MDKPPRVLDYAPGAPSRLREIALLFTRLGFTAFGGPAVHVALMEDEVVKRRHWLDREHFLDLVAAVNFIPGPNSTELAIHLGWILRGFPGLLVAGACFIIPAMLIILPLAWMYVTWSQLPQVQHILTGINACVVAIVAAALAGSARSAAKDAFTETVAVMAALAGFLPQLKNARCGAELVPQAELLILAAAALAGAIRYGRPKVSGKLPLLAVPVPIFGAILPQTAAGELARMALVFLKIGATLFGSGYVLVSYLRSDFVQTYGWLSEQQLLDAVAVGQVTPGPLLTTATFIGYVLGSERFGLGLGGGIAGGVLATACIFLPSFIFVAFLGPVLHRLRQNRLARRALDAMNAAVVALILVVTIQLAEASLTDGMTLLIALATAAALLLWNVNSTWLILGAGVVSWAWYR